MSDSTIFGLDAGLVGFLLLGAAAVLLLVSQCVQMLFAMSSPPPDDGAAAASAPAAALLPRAPAKVKSKTAPKSECAASLMQGHAADLESGTANSRPLPSARFVTTTKKPAISV